MTPAPSLPNPLTSPVGHLQGRFRQWWQSRLPLTDTLALTQRNVYILPTRPGFMLGATLLVLLVASINYQLNLGYLLTFLLAGSAVVGMHVCHGTLRGMTLHLIAPNNLFAMDTAFFDVKLINARRSPRYAIGLSVLGTGHWSWTDVAAPGRSTGADCLPAGKTWSAPGSGADGGNPLSAGHLPGLDRLATGG